MIFCLIMNKKIFSCLDFLVWVYLWVAPILSCILIVTVIDLLHVNLNIELIDFAMISPLIYLSWLLLFLLISSTEMVVIGKFFPKQSRFENSHSVIDALYILSCIFTFKRMLMLFSLPLFDHLRDVPYSLQSIKRLAMRAYSTSTHMGIGSEVHAWPLDPDLTYIADHVVIGIYSKLIAHGHKRSEGGRLVLLTAPIKIESFVKIGNSCTVNMGVSIGKGSIIEANSHISPFTEIPAGEIWGGNPAVFIRKVKDSKDWS